MNTPETSYPGRWWHAIDGDRIQCDLCPRDCKLHEGQRGACFVRKMENGAMVLTTYGRSSGFCIDPVEKKPLNHFYPGTSILSFGTAGCNLACKFCQNWDISKSKDMDRLMDAASPVDIAAAARRYGADAVAYTYNDPVIFAEYAIDTALACREQGIRNVAVTAGYIHAAPAKEFFAVMDAANVDLKAFTEDFYWKLCVGHLQPVLDTLVYLHHETDCWVEITTLLIPGRNDSPAEVKQLADWVMKELGPDVPLHFTAFHPDWKMDDLPPTPPATLTQARRIALDAGLHHVFTGNVHDSEGGTTFCPKCQAALIVRDWYDIRRYDLTDVGACPHCGTAIAGRFGKALGRNGEAFGPRRIPVALGAMRRAETLATPHGPLPFYLTAPDTPPRGLVLLALLPGDPRVPVLESALLTAGMAVLTPHLLSAAELHFPDSVHNVPLLTERILHLLEFATKDGDTLDLPVGLYGTGPLTPAAVRAAARRDAQVRAVACHGGIVDLAGLQYLVTLSAPLLMVFAAEDDYGPAAFRRASTHLTCPWESTVLIPGTLDAEPVTAWFARHLAPGVSSD